MADKLCLSPSYLGDLIKRTTGIKASKYIQRMAAQEAKKLLASGKSVSMTAYALGFNYPQHFSRFFKREAGISPRENIQTRN